MIARARRLSVAASAVLVVVAGLLYGYAAFGAGGMYSWWHKAGAVLMFMSSMMYLGAELLRRGEARSGQL